MHTHKGRREIISREAGAQQKGMERALQAPRGDMNGGSGSEALSGKRGKVASNWSTKKGLNHNRRQLFNKRKKTGKKTSYS